MKTPEFWLKKSLVSFLLLPFAKIYGYATQLRLKLIKSQKIAIPVICIGNITAGGTGKTPVSLSIAKMLETEMFHPFFVTRGYGGKKQNVIVNNKKHTAEEVGDEPLLLSRQAPTIVNANRYQGALLALEEGADVIIMDDGFQNPKLHKDLSFLVFDGHYGTGNGRIIPAGPLRETLSNGLKRADALIIIGKDEHNLAKKSKLPTFFAHTEPVETILEKGNIVAFAGIGHPDKFYHTLQEQGFNILEKMNFPDHHFYTDSEIESIIQKARNKNAEIYTTGKDYVKIPHKYQKQIHVLEIAVIWDNPNELSDFIKLKISKNI